MAVKFQVCSFNSSIGLVMSRFIPIYIDMKFRIWYHRIRKFQTAFDEEGEAIQIALKYLSTYEAIAFYTAVSPLSDSQPTIHTISSSSNFSAELRFHHEGEGFDADSKSCRLCGMGA
ncbi:hypothetical protein TNCV_230011 [Trichonephila clavipes]|nr:hypothetical protein TNCV_230011 [Trichonephila clavipes]